MTTAETYECVRPMNVIRSHDHEVFTEQDRPFC